MTVEAIILIALGIPVALVAVIQLADRLKSKR